jgi:proteasome lid subunit RPN8/RPN11
MNEAAELIIPVAVRDAMVAHCQREAPLEACGLLGGVAPHVRSCHPLRNVAASETRYRADERDVITINRQLREGGAEILAIYHSHPRWAAVPSKTDLQENFWEGTPRVIVSLLDPGPEVRIWRLGTDSYEEIAWRLAEESGSLDVEPPA